MNRSSLTKVLALAFTSALALTSGPLAAQEAPDLGDLIILYRDANGVPLLTADLCWQPLPSATCPAECVLVPAAQDPAVSVIPVDPATCALPVACALCTQEADFGRINEARSPDAVFDAQLADVIVNLATADCRSLDPAGRMVTSRVADGTVSSTAIDSPLQNLAIYRQLMLTGYLGDAPGIALPAGVLETAARGLGAASDKTGEVNVDIVAYVNQIMGLPDMETILGAPICIQMKEEVTGVVQEVTKCFLNYGNVPTFPEDSLAYAYDRTANFGALPAPPYIPASDPQAGWFEYLAILSADPLSFAIVQGPILGAVFGTDLGFLGGNIGGFAQAADDARAVIDFMHTWPVPGDFATSLVCGDSGLIAYDVSLSEESGLQVPTRIVDGSVDREFFVNVFNDGPDPATGTVTVTAVEANGTPIPTFPRILQFTDLAMGATASFTEYFDVNLGHATTIYWTATVAAQYDVNSSNNSVTATSTVKLTSGGGRR